MIKINSNLLLLMLYLTSCLPNNKTKTEPPNQTENAKIELMPILSSIQTLPASNKPIVLRTDFSNETKWKTICRNILTPNSELGFTPNVVFISDTTFQNLTEEQLIAINKEKYNYDFIFLVDRTTMTVPENPVFVMGLGHNLGLKFRTIPSEMWSIENNLSISNMDFEEFSGAAGKDGVFRGFNKYLNR